MLELAAKANASFLFASSSEVYGDPTVHPQREDYFGNVNPVGVRAVYDEGKRFGEALTMAYVRKYGVDARIVRIFNTYGARMQDDGRVVSNFIRQALSGKPLTVYGDGKQTRSFCYILDMVDGIAKAMLAKDTLGEIINLGNNQPVALSDFIKTLEKIIGKKAKIIKGPLPPGDVLKTWANIDKAKRLLLWEPQTTLEKGLRVYIQTLNGGIN